MSIAKNSFMVLLLLPIFLISSIAIASDSGQKAFQVEKVPMELSPAVYLIDGSVAGYADGEIVFVKGSLITKRVAAPGEPRLLEPFPPDNPSGVIYVSDTGQVLVVTPENTTLYNSLVGIADLKKACYYGGNVYLYDGRSLYILNLFSRSWAVISKTGAKAANVYSIANATVDEVVCSTSYVAVKMEPVVPPGYGSGLARIYVVDNNTHTPVNGNLYIYFSDGLMASYRLVEGLASVQAPLEPLNVTVYVESNSTWHIVYRGYLVAGRDYYFIYDSKALPSVPPSNVYAVVSVLRGAAVEYTVAVPSGARLLGVWGNTVLLYNGGSVEALAGGVPAVSIPLDSEPVAASIFNGVAAVLSKKGTLYVINTTSLELKSVYSYPGSKGVAVTAGYVIVWGDDVIHIISTRTWKEITLYDTYGIRFRGVPVVEPELDTVVIAVPGATLVLKPVVNEPSNIEASIPHTITVKVLDPWGKPVSGAPVYIDGVDYGVTVNGTIKVSVFTGTHLVEAYPPPDMEWAGPARETVEVKPDTTEIVLKLKRLIYYLNVTLVDPETNAPRVPLELTVYSGETPVASRQVRVQASFLLPAGEYRIYVKDSEKTPWYLPTYRVVKLSADTNVSIRLELAKYRVLVKAIARDTGEPVPAEICYAGTCSEQEIMLPKGIRTITVKPLVEINGTRVYGDTTTTINVRGDMEYRVYVSRVMSVLRVTLVDADTGKPVNVPVTVSTGGVEKKTSNGKVTLLVPAGRIDLKVVPEELYTPQTFHVDASTDSNITLKLKRETVTVTVTVKTPVSTQGIITLENLDTGRKYQYLFTGKPVKEKIPVGRYRIEFSGEGVTKVSKVTTIYSDKSILLVASPSLLTLIRNNILFLLGVVSPIVSLTILWYILKRAKRHIEETTLGSRLVGSGKG